jgi:hypothetical protein
MKKAPASASNPSTTSQQGMSLTREQHRKLADVQQPGPRLEPGRGSEGRGVDEGARGAGAGAQRARTEPGAEGRPQLVIPTRYGDLPNIP